MYNVNTKRFIKSQYTLYRFGVTIMSKGKIILACLTTLTLMGLTLYLFNPAFSPLQTNKVLSSQGSIKTIGVGVYSDSGCTNKLSSIDWGTLEPGANKNVTTYIRNEGTSTMTLSLSTSNWNPTSASQYITLSWDYGGKSLAVNEVLKVIFTLKISASTTGITSYSFDITITGTG